MITVTIEPITFDPFVVFIQAMIVLTILLAFVMMVRQFFIVEGFMRKGKKAERIYPIWNKLGENKWWLKIGQNVFVAEERNGLVYAKSNFVGGEPEVFTTLEDARLSFMRREGLII